MAIKIKSKEVCSVCNKETLEVTELFRLNYPFGKKFRKGKNHHKLARPTMSVKLRLEKCMSKECNLTSHEKLKDVTEKMKNGNANR